MRARAVATVLARAFAPWLLATACGTALAQPDVNCTTVQDIGTALQVVTHEGGTPQASTRTVSIPDKLPLALRSERVHIHYSIDVSACASAPSPALWVFRVGAPYRISAGDTPLSLMSANAMAATGATARQRTRADSDGIYNGRIPALFALPPGARTVQIELQTLPYLPSGVVRLAIGPTQLLLAQHTASVRTVVGYADAASGVVLVLGLFSFLLWMSRRGDLNLLWMALACGLWGTRGLIYFNNTLPGDPLLFEQLNPVNALLSAATIAAAALHLLRDEGERRTKALLILTLACISAFFVAEFAGRGALLARSLAQVVGTGFICWLGIEAWRRRSTLPARHLVVMLLCVMTLLVCVVHDLTVAAGLLPPTSHTWLFWGFVTVLIGFALLSGEYVVATLNRAERSNEELELHVARKTAELEHSYARLRTSEQDTVRAQERERLLRDMHDGLGAQLMTALRGVERGALGPQQVAQSLQDSLDELRLLMDSTDIDHYLPGALAAWRNRWDTRLAAVGVTLDWRIDESLDQAQLSSETALQVMRILQEAAANVVKHSQARHMRLLARVHVHEGQRTLHIEIEDDGTGLGDAAVRAGARGMKNMHYRAGQIGAALTIASRQTPEQGSRVSLNVPLA